MLAVTSSAAEAIRTITSAIPQAAGIRLAPVPGPPVNGSGPETLLEAQPAPAPDAADEVLHEDGASVFIEPALVPHLDDKVLDVEMDGAQATFVLSGQG
jgi:Fe-S cluster assembly iron-binding protein IscA